MDSHYATRPLTAGGLYSSAVAAQTKHHHENSYKTNGHTSHAAGHKGTSHGSGGAISDFVHSTLSQANAKKTTPSYQK